MHSSGSERHKPTRKSLWAYVSGNAMINILLDSGYAIPALPFPPQIWLGHIECDQQEQPEHRELISAEEIAEGAHGHWSESWEDQRGNRHLDSIWRHTHTHYPTKCIICFLVRKERGRERKSPRVGQPYLECSVKDTEKLKVNLPCPLFLNSILERESPGSE